MDADGLDVRDRAMARAGRVLARRPHSAAELERRLARIAPAEVIEGVVADLERLGYVDDAALALSLAGRRLGDGWGSLRVAHDLERLGIPAEAAADAMAQAEGDEPGAARALVRARGLEHDPRRAWALLARRGFREDAIEIDG